MIFTLALALLSATGLVEAASAGCGKTPPSSGTKSITSNNKSRQYILQLPSSYDSSKPHKLIFGYHWRDGSMNTVAQGQYYGLQPLAGNNAIFIAPNGLNAGWANAGGEDIKLTDDILAYVKSNLCIDESNIFAAGWSYGGSMSHSVACSRPTVFKAVAVIAGAQLSGCDGGTTPVPYLGIHGTADDVLPIALGRQLRDKWLGLDGCQSKTASEPSPGSGTHIKTQYSCRSGTPVSWIAHSGGHVPDPKDSNSSQSWAPAEIWAFFTQSFGGGTVSSTPAVTSTASGGGPSSTTTSSPPTGSCAAMYGQCGGTGWSGAKCCQSGTCKYSNDFYSQCL